MIRRTVAWMLAGSCAAAWVCSIWIASLPGTESLAGPGESTDYYVLAVAGVGCEWAVTGALFVTLRPRNILGWLVLVAGISNAGQVAMAAYGSYGLLIAHPHWPAARKGSPSCAWRAARGR